MFWFPPKKTQRDLSREYRESSSNRNTRSYHTTASRLHIDKRHQLFNKISNGCRQDLPTWRRATGAWTVPLKSSTLLLEIKSESGCCYNKPPRKRALQRAPWSVSTAPAPSADTLTMGALGAPRGCSSHRGCLGCSDRCNSSAEWHRGWGGRADAGGLPERGTVMGRAGGESLWPNNGSLESMHVRCFHRGKPAKCTLSSNLYEEKKEKRTFKTSVVCYTVYSDELLSFWIKRLTLAILLLFSISMLKKYSYSHFLEWSLSSKRAKDKSLLLKICSPKPLITLKHLKSAQTLRRHIKNTL